jgi:hypothetical protein
MTVAVVLSNFNHGRYLRESLEAIRNQTRPADEIVVVDDGSTDNSATIIDEFMQCGPNVRLIRNPRNIGLQASMARALPTVTAEYLVWAAADDRLLPTFLEKSMALLERYPSSGLCFSELSVLKGDTTEIERFATIPWLSRLYDLSNLPAYLDPSAIRDRMRRAYLPMTSNSVIVRRQALLELGGYPGQLEWYADSFAYTVVALRHGACVVADGRSRARGAPLDPRPACAGVVSRHPPRVPRVSEQLLTLRDAHSWAPARPSPRLGPRAALSVVDPQRRSAPSRRNLADRTDAARRARPCVDSSAAGRSPSFACGARPSGALSAMFTSARTAIG